MTESLHVQELVQSKVEAMVQHLLVDSHQAPSLLQRCLATRDGLAFSLLWSTCLRGINAREVCCRDFWIPSSPARACQPALPNISPCFTLETGSKVEVVPQPMKTSISVNSASIQLTVQSNQLLDPFRWLQWHRDCSHAAGSPIGNLLVRPVNKQGTAFLEKPLENSSLLCRLVSLLKQLQFYEGKSLHSFRRGMAQQLQAQGSTEPATLKQLPIKTPAILQSRYLASGRYHSGVKRVHGAMSPRPDPEGHAFLGLPADGGSGAPSYV